MAPLKPLALLALVPAFTLLASPMASQASPATGYSHDRLAPTLLTGSKKVVIKGAVQNVGTVTGGISPTAEYVTFTVPSGKVFTSLTLTNYTSIDNLAFVGLMAGNQWTAARVGQTLPNALAYSHFGVSGVCAETYGGSGNGLPTGANDCASNPLSQTDLFVKSLKGALTAPLQAGDYTVWIQNTGSELTEYEFAAQFEYAPAPGPLPVLGAAAGLGFSRRLRQRIRSAKPQG
jgi:hypothetical protein